MAILQFRDTSEQCQKDAAIFPPFNLNPMADRSFFSYLSAHLSLSAITIQSGDGIEPFHRIPVSESTETPARLLDVSKTAAPRVNTGSSGSGE
jgi:hypothetical protein